MSEARYYAKREAGLSEVRSDGSLTSAETDRQSGAAEKYAADYVGLAFNEEIYATHGDDGCDIRICGYCVEVIWLGFEKNTTIPRFRGHVIINEYEQHRHADVYWIIRGSIEFGFSIAGWCWHDDICKTKDFGYGPKLCMHTDDLR